MSGAEELRELRESLASFNETKHEVEQLLESNPHNEEFQQSLRELESEITVLESTISDLQRSFGPQLDKSQLPSPPEQLAEEPPKWSRESHPAFQRGDAGAPSETAQSTEHVFEVGQSVLARYHEDRKFYAARITSQTGSRADPIFTVLFTDYGNSESVRLSGLRSLPSTAGQKRKAESHGSVGPPKSAGAPTAGPNPSLKTISAEADVDADKLRQHHEENSAEPPESKKKKQHPEKKISTTKRLESARGSWQDFQSKGKPGMKKESMFKNKDRFQAPSKPSGPKQPRERMY